MQTRSSALRYLERLSSSKALWVLTAVGAVSLLSYGIYRNWQELARYEWQVDYPRLALSFVAYSFALAGVLVGWNSIMGHLGSKVGFRRNTKVYCYSNLAKRLPTSIWLFASRAHLYEKEGTAKSVTSLGTLLEFCAIGFSGVLTFVATSSLFPSARLWDRGVLFILAVLAAPVLLVSRPNLLVRGLEFLLAKSHHEGLSLTLRSRDMMWWSLLYSIGWVLGGLFLYLLIGAFHPLPASRLPTVIAAWTLSGLVALLNFVLPIGVGVRELTLAYLLTCCLPFSVAIVISIASRIWLALCELFWVLISLRL